MSLAHLDPSFLPGRCLLALAADDPSDQEAKEAKEESGSEAARLAATELDRNAWPMVAHGSVAELGRLAEAVLRAAHSPASNMLFLSLTS